MAPVTYIPSKAQESGFSSGNFTCVLGGNGDSAQYSDSGSNILENTISDNSGDDSNNKAKTKCNEAGLKVPLFIFRNGLSSLEAISKYLMENASMRFCEIARALNRDDRTIWDAYNSAKSKDSDWSKDSSDILIPVSIFAGRKLSVLESIASYMKNELNMRYCEISRLLNKDARTIWTVCNRARMKNASYAS